MVFHPSVILSTYHPLSQDNTDLLAHVGAFRQEPQNTHATPAAIKKVLSRVTSFLLTRDFSFIFP
jgi:hypothetical protein